MDPEEILFTTGDDVIEKKQLEIIEVYERNFLQENSNHLLSLNEGRSSDEFDKTLKIGGIDSNLLHVVRDWNLKIDELMDGSCDMENSSRIFLEKIVKRIYLHDRKYFSRKLSYFEPSNTINLEINVQERREIEIYFENTALEATTVKVEDIFSLVCLSDVKLDYISKCSIEIGNTFKIKLKVCFSEEGAKIYPLVLKISRNESSDYFDYLLVEPTFNVQPRRRRLIIQDEPSNNAPRKRCIIQESVFRGLDRRKKNDTFFTGTRKVVKCEDTWRRSGLKLSEVYSKCPPEKILLKKIDTELYKSGLQISVSDYDIPKNLRYWLETFKMSNSKEKVLENAALRQLFCNPTTQEIVPNKIGLDQSNYHERFSYLVWLEEFQKDEELHSYDQKGIYLINDPLFNGLIGIKLESLSEGRPSVLQGDVVTISPVASKTQFYFGKIKEMTEKCIYVKCKKRPKEVNEIPRYISRNSYNVTFELNRMILKLSHHFLENMPSFVVQNILFPSSYNKNPISIDLKPMFNDSISSNELQCQAIKNIVQNTAFPAPYILFGPPGTGKTATFVEAIVQIWDIFESSRICVCASSNAACDVITQRLKNYIPTTEMMRIYGLSRNTPGSSKEFESFSNYDASTKSTFFPDLEEFRNRRIIIMTPVMAGKVMIRLKNILRLEVKFDYLFMDEAGHCVETDLLIPMCAFFESNSNGRLILSGDPMQLGPVVQSRVASELGFGTSFLERLMNTCELYKKDPVTLQYNSHVITKLVNNYRSHEKILFTSNYLFYENELQAKASDKIISEFCSWDELPTPNCPIIFHSVKGVEQKEISSPSYFNLEEIRIIENYLKKIFHSKSNQFSLEQKDVGVISPYKKQVLKIRERLSDKDFGNVGVASVEEFQGQERKIIIVSTVRSRFELIPSDYKFGLGFLRNEKRLNVALTRAMVLLIVIGNPDLLQCDPNWKFFIDYCVKNGSFVGEKPCCISDLEENVKLLSI